MDLKSSLKNITANKIAFFVIIAIIGFLTLWFIGLRVGKPVAQSICISLMSNNTQEARMDRVSTVEAETTTLGTMSKRIRSVGNIRATKSVTIKSEMAGRITEILFEEGSEVKEGDLIIKFEDKEYLGAYKQAEGEHTLAKANFERSEKLFQQKVESPKKFDEAKASLQISEGKLLSAQANVDRAHIKAPFSGVIGLINVTPGAFVQGATDLVTIVNDKTVDVTFKVPENNALEVGQGQVVEVKLDAHKNQVFTGTVTAVDASIDKLSHSLEVKAQIPNPNGMLRDGQFAEVSVIVGEKGNTISVDEATINRMGEIEYVWIVERGRAEQRRVLTGTRENGRVEIIAGLLPDQIVVTSGQLKLSPGVKVAITNIEEENAAAEAEIKAAETGKEDSN